MNINILPFRLLRITDTLGSTNPQLTIIVEEPWPFRWKGFSPFFAVTLDRILIRAQSTQP